MKPLLEVPPMPDSTPLPAGIVRVSLAVEIDRLAYSEERHTW